MDHSGGFGLILIQIVRRKRQLAVFRLRRAAVALALYLGVIGVLVKLEYPPLQAIAFGFLSAVARRVPLRAVSETRAEHSPSHSPGGYCTRLEGGTV